MLAYYVEWHMREALRPMLFCDEDQDAKKTRDPGARPEAPTFDVITTPNAQQRRVYDLLETIKV